MASFDFKDAVETVTIDLTNAHIWDLSSINALDLAVIRLRREGSEVKIVGLNKASETLIEKLAIHDKGKDNDKFFNH